MRTALSLIALCLALLPPAPDSASAWPPVAPFGHRLVETFADGFDHPDAVLASENVAFVPGRARLLAGGRLLYGFDYSLVDSPWGPVQPASGLVRVAFFDEGMPASALRIEILCGPDEAFPFALPMRFLLEVSDAGIVVTAESSEFGTWTATYPRAIGPTTLRVEPLPVGQSTIETSNATYFVEAPQFYLGAHMTSLDIRGSGLDLDDVVVQSYTLVGTEPSSWGRLKREY